MFLNILFIDNFGQPNKVFCVFVKYNLDLFGIDYWSSPPGKKRRRKKKKKPQLLHNLYEHSGSSGLVA